MSETKRTCPFGTVGDQNQKAILYQILQNGFRDENPRPHYEDMYHNAHLSDDCKYVITEDGNKIEIEEGTAFTNGSDVTVYVPAHTLSINHVVTRYDLAKGECPILTLRPIAWKSAVKEILWIYQMQSNKLSDLHDLGIKYWDQWDVGDGTIGC